MKTFADEAARESFKAFADFLFNPFEEGLSGMLSGFADTLRQMASNQLALSLFETLGKIGGSGGGIAGAIGSFFRGGIQDNGGRGAAGEPVLIGTGAQPEAFIPDTAGSFVPQQQMGAMGAGDINVAAPVVNVSPQVINVQDPADIPAAMQGAEGESVILNVLRNNPDVIRQVAA